MKCSVMPPPPDPMVWQTRLRDLEQDLGLPSYGRAIHPEDEGTERRRRLIGIPPPVSVFETAVPVAIGLTLATAVVTVVMWLVGVASTAPAFTGATGF